MENEVRLDIKKSLTKLAGYSYGKMLYDTQVKNKINFEQNIKIVFPDGITDVASSFVQGFFYDLVEKIGIKGIQNQVEIESLDDEMKSKVIDYLI